MVKLTKKFRQTPALFLLVTFLIFGFFQNSRQLSSAYTGANEILPAVKADMQPITPPTTSVVEISPITTTPTPISSDIKGLKIDAINLNIPLGKTTLGANRELLVPADANKAAWYKQGPKPGEAGTALITGHLDQSGGVPGVFYNLRKLEPQDIIQVKRDDGKVATFKVDKLESYAQNNTFPWHLVYKTSGDSALRIITCDGVFNPKTGRYSRNLVVYASLVSIE